MGHAHRRVQRGPKICVTECLLSLGTRIYIVLGWGSQRSLRYTAVHEGGGACPPGESKGTQGLCVWMSFIIRNKNIYGLGVVTWTVCKIFDIMNFSPYKCLCYQIWPWPKIGQGYPRVIIWTNYDGSRFSNVTYQFSWKSAWRFQRKRFLKVFYHI